MIVHTPLTEIRREYDGDYRLLNTYPMPGTHHAFSHLILTPGLCGKWPVNPSFFPIEETEVRTDEVPCPGSCSLYMVEPGFRPRLVWLQSQVSFHSSTLGINEALLVQDMQEAAEPKESRGSILE